MVPNRKIYFCGSIRGGRDDAALYAKIIEHLASNFGVSVFLCYACVLLPDVLLFVIGEHV